jgi:drug/metabolite transporter (DMT)-like permease
VVVASDLLVVGRLPGAPDVDHRRVGDRVLAQRVHGAVRPRRADRDASPPHGGAIRAVGWPGLAAGAFLACTFFFFIASLTRTTVANTFV